MTVIKTGSPSGRPKSFNDPNTGLPPEEKNIPEPFSPLGSDGLRYWVSIWKHSGHLDENVDVNFIEEICHAVDELALMRRELSTGIVPRTYKSSNGSIVIHPYVNQIKDYRSQINGWLSHYGFGPSERQKLGLGADTDTLVDSMRSMESQLIETQRQMREGK